MSLKSDIKHSVDTRLNQLKCFGPLNDLIAGLLKFGAPFQLFKVIYDSIYSLVDTSNTVNLCKCQLNIATHYHYNYPGTLR